MSQLKRLKTALISKPDDPFLLYAIAMEHLKLNDFISATEQFEMLIRSHPDYVPAYFQYGLSLAENNQTEKAKSILTNGCEVAKRNGDLHAAAEMSQALEGIEEFI